MRIPIKAAKDFGNQYKKDQVIILCWDRESGDTWVTTWGKDKKQCEQAASGGQKILKLLENKEMPMHYGSFEVKKDEVTGEKYWWGAEEGWKDPENMDSELTMNAKDFGVGAVITLEEPMEVL